MLARKAEIAAEHPGLTSTDKYPMVVGRPFNGRTDNVKVFAGDKSAGIKPVWGHLLQQNTGSTVVSVSAGDVIRWCGDVRTMLTGEAREA